MEEAVADKFTLFGNSGSSEPDPEGENNVLKRKTIFKQLNAGNYTLSITNPSTMEKLSHKINIVKRIDKNSNLKMYYGAGSYYKVRVYDNYGRIAQNVSVKFSINGKNYYRTTDKNGYAQFTGFNGEYEITVKCGNDTKTERIRLNKNTPLTQIILD